MKQPDQSNNESGLLQPAALVRTEAAALEALATRLEGPMAGPFARAVELILGCGQGNGRVVVTGMGKSGIIAQKIAATLSSTGSPALFLHPAEAVHGDLGVLMPGDVVIALSGSGETEEILRLLATLKRKGDALVSFCCNLNSTLAQASDVALDCGVEREACGLNLAPTASTTTMLALGDALAIAVSLRKGFREASDDGKVTCQCEPKLLRAAGTPDTDLLHVLVVRIAGQDKKGFAVRRQLGANEGLLV